MNQQELDKSYNKVKIALMAANNSAFISSILFSLKFVWDESCKTAYTDGTVIGMSPKFWEPLTLEQRVGLMAHEAWHVAFNHIFRGQHLDGERYNKAADHVINLMLLASGFKLPPNGLHDPQYRDMSTEQVYKLLPPTPKKNGNGSSDGFDCDIRSPKKGTEDDVQQAVKEIITKAATRARMKSPEAYGSIPNDVKIMLDELIDPVLPWQVILQNYMSSFAADDFSWRWPNRRFMPEYYLPSLFSESLGEICVAVDTSCSVSDEQFRAFLSEINYIKETLNPALTTIIDFDTKIHVVHKLSADDTMQGVGFSGRGGTNLTPVFKYYEKTKPTVLIVFSDLECSAIREDPGYPVVWICVDNKRAKVNFGEIIHYDTSLTNPLKVGYKDKHFGVIAITEQAEPNGIFASKNTSATWVMCAGSTGTIEPIYVETKVTVYPYPVNVDFSTNRVTKAGKATITISTK